MTIVIQGQENVMKARTFFLYQALKLECLGMKRSGKSVYSIVKKQFGFKGNKLAVLAQLETYINNNK